MFLLILGVGVSWRIGAPWPLFVAVALLAILVGPTVLASWRHRDDLAALRRARRRIADAYDKPLVELGGMVGTRPAVLRQVVRSRCEAADSDGVTLLIEVAEGDVMERAWLEEGSMPPSGSTPPGDGSRCWSGGHWAHSLEPICGQPAV